ncbi:DUF7475 family protein [Halosegnis marinus]|uniref:Uncharacterized protein n=1 Tax=Halosegnis marinus TaxID=3034023 RepID=A0ABD5ZKV5_9EURY|nr:hypothetical protein [Halosegnis sp. DT85]
MATQTASSGSTLATDSLTALHWAGILLSLATGLLHLGLAASFGASGLGVAFAVAGVGYLAGVAAVLVDYRRRAMYLVGIPFTLGQVVAWYALNAPDFSTLGYADKAIQVALVVVLAVLYRRA